MSSLSLGGALLAAIATRVTVDSGQDAGNAGSVIQFRANSAFERALKVLFMFDAARTAADGQPVLAVSAFRMQSQWQIPQSDPRMGDLLTAFLAVSCRYHGLQAGDSWFRAPAHLADAMDHLAASGYAQAQQDLFRWAPQIAPHLAEAGVQHDISAEASAAQLARQDAEARKAFDTMPVFLRKRFFSRPEIDLLAFMSVVAHCWDGARWRPYTRERRFLDFPDARQLSERMINLAGHKRAKERSPR